MTFTAELGGTLALRPYVFVLLAIYLALAARDLGLRGTLAFLGWGWGVAFLAEYASTRVGIPFGLYHYTGDTRGAELYLSNVPFFDSLSFPFLAYAAWCLARWALRESASPRTVAVAAALMMLLDVVIDPVAVRGERWFLGRIFYYPEGGIYFGVPLSNFAGWAIVGAVIVGGYVLAARGRPPRGSPRLGAVFYYLILLFNLAVTALIRERVLLGAGILLHLAVFLVLWWAVGRVSGPAGGPKPAPGSDGVGQSTEHHSKRGEDSASHECAGVPDVHDRVLRPQAEAQRTHALPPSPHAGAPVPL